MRRQPVLLRLLMLLRPFAGQAALSVLLGSATVAAGIGLLGLSAHLIASAALQPSIADLQVAIVGVRFFGISRAVFRYLERLVTHNINFRLLGALRVWFYHRLEPLAPARVQPYRSADLLNRAVADIDALENFYVRAVAPPLSALLVVAGTGWFVSRYDAALALLLTGMLLAAGLGLPVLTHALARKPGREMVRQREELHALLMDTVQGLPDLLAFGQENAQQRRIQEAGGKMNSAQRGLARAGAIGNALSLLISGLALWLVLLAAIPLVGSTLDGVALAVLALVALASFEAVVPLTQAAQRLEDSFASASRLFDLVDSPEQSIMKTPVQTQTSETFPVLAPREGLHLRIQGLEFAYDAAQGPVLKDFDLDLPPGKRVAIVGASGAGKTSLFNVLLRFWEYQRGAVTFNGVNIRACDPEDVRAQMALFAQSTYIFAGTLRQNILLANPQAAPQDLERVVDQVQLSGLTARLPQGLDIWVGERGMQLSGGERQRVAAARALLRDAPLLLLDEPTANLDAHTERRLLETLMTAAGGRSLIAIMHRLIGLEQMDEILVLRGGCVVERGTHAQLLAKGGLYAQMLQIQSDILRDNP